MLTHGSRQPRSWLIFDVGQKSVSVNPNAPEELQCDRFRVDGRELVCEFGGKEVRRVAFDSILGWCDTAQDSYSIVMKEGRSLDFPGLSDELEVILLEHFPDSFHSW